MTIELTNIVVKHERRLRLVFSNGLAAGAFGTPAPAFYVVDNQDGRGPSPGVASAIIVSGATTNVELALSADLVPGALYRVTAISVPALDASTSTSASDQNFRFPELAQPANVEAKTLDADLLLYGRDMVWTGSDYLETVEGDLGRLGGAANAQSAIRRRLLGKPLAWAPGYSPDSRQFVDAPLSGIGGLKGRLQAQALRDNRVRSAAVKLMLDDDSPAESYFEITSILVGGRAPEPVSVVVPVT